MKNKDNAKLTQPQTMLDEAREKFSGGDREGAAAVCEKIIESHPDCAEAYLMLAACPLSAGDVDASGALLGKAADIAARSGGEDALALAHAAMRLELAPEYCAALYENAARRLEGEEGDKFLVAVAYNKMGLCRFRHGASIEDEAACFERALSLLPRGAQEGESGVTLRSLVICNLAECRMREGRYDDAKKLYLDAAEIFTRSMAHSGGAGVEHYAVCHHNLAEIYLREGENIQARKNVTHAIDALCRHYDDLRENDRSHLASLYNFRGTMRFHMGDYSGEIEDCSRSIEIARELQSGGYGTATTYSNRAEAYEHLEQYDNALADYVSALSVVEKYGGDSDDADELMAIYSFSIGKMHERLNDLDSAVDYYERAIGHFSLFTAQDSAKESESVNQLIQLEALCRFRLGMCLCEGAAHDYHACMTHHNAAIALLERVDSVDAFEALAALHTSVGEIFEMFEEYESAEEHFAKSEEYRAKSNLISALGDIFDDDVPCDSGDKPCEQGDEPQEELERESDIWEDSSEDTPMA
ncbi:MAG: tetratricopeptide repeat protein [Clostridia bacterium]|nr:tetratricopeptide repeat protein [Clostridia bacterium]